MFLLLAICLLSRVDATCTPGLDKTDLVTKANTLTNLGGELFLLNFNSQGISGVPMVQTIMAKAKAFKTKFDGFELKEKNFHLTEDLGLGYIMRGFKYAASKLIHDMDEHCRWLGGELFAPSWQEAQGLPEFVASYGGKADTIVSLPAYKKDDKIIYYPSNKSAEWLTTFTGLKPADFSADNKKGIAISFQPMKFEDSTTSAIAGQAICMFPTPRSVRRLPYYNSVVDKAATNIDTDKLSELITAVNDIPDPANACLQISFSLPPIVNKYVTFAQQKSKALATKYRITSDEELNTRLEDINKTMQGINIMSDTLKSIVDLYTGFAGQTPANHGDWSAVNFDLFEAEEQIILTLASIVLLESALLVTLAFRSCRDWQRRRRRRKLLTRYPNLGDMPLLERSKLM